MQNRQLQTWLSEDEYEQFEYEWQEQLELRSELKDKQQDKPQAVELWNYFSSVIDWTQAIFPKYRKEMKGIDWGYLYNDFKDETLDPNKLEEQVKSLMIDDEVQKKKGIYEYVLRKDEKFLNLRAFTDQQKREMYERQDGLCNIRKKPYPIEEMEADHIDPWSEGGRTDIKNGQMIHKEENRRKSNK